MFGASVISFGFLCAAIPSVKGREFKVAWPLYSAWMIAMESLGDHAWNGGVPLMPKDFDNRAAGSQFKGALGIGSNHNVAAVFVRSGGTYLRFRPKAAIGDGELRDDVADWNDVTGKMLQERLDKMLPQGSSQARSGDIVLLFNIQDRFGTVNDDAEEELDGWHGGPTQAESVTPLVMGASFLGDVPQFNEAFTGQMSGAGGDWRRNSHVRQAVEKIFSVCGVHP